jgi:hypothetical protein
MDSDVSSNSLIHAVKKESTQSSNSFIQEHILMEVVGITKFGH